MRPRLGLALVLLLVLPAKARAEDPPPPLPPAPAEGQPPAPGTDPAEDLFKKGCDQQERAQYVSAHKTFKKLLEQFPQSKHAEEAEDRSAPNAFLGYSQIRYGGPSERRIDVALMGDGYPIEQQKKFDDAAEGEMKLLFQEALYDEYEWYFNVWRFNLASKDKGVDDVPRDPAGFDATDKKKYKQHIREYSTALDCKAAGPQGQVMADPGRVNHYLQYLKVSDGLTIAFAQMGSLGMGGGGIATTGPRGVVVHEFGHAFIGLLDEYTGNPNPPAGRISAANATTDPKSPPWKHFLDAKVPGVSVIEGGATYSKGVWRPAPSCAMNVGGGAYCPVCREAGVLCIYEYVSPIDEAFPEKKSVRVVPGQETEIAVLPMRPKSHDLQVEWFARSLPAAKAVTPSNDKPSAGPDGPDADPLGIGMDSKQEHRGDWRGRERAADGPRVPLRGEKVKDVDKRMKDGRARHAPDLAGLKPGRYELTAVVRDTALLPGEKFPWVLKDPYGLLEERSEWVVDVVPASSSSAAPAPAPAPAPMDR